MNFKIDQPCSELYDKMNSVEKGKFCTSCNNNVLDFTSKTDEEILKILNANQENVICCRIQEQRLKQPPNYRNIKLTVSKSVTSVMLLTLLSSNFIAQTKEKDSVKIIDEVMVVGLIHPKNGDFENIYQKPILKRVNGWIKKENGGKAYKADVNLLNLSFRHQTITNNQGNFNLRISEKELQNLNIIAITTFENPSKIYLYKLRGYDLENISISLEEAFSTVLNSKKIRKGENYYFDGEVVSRNQFLTAVENENVDYFYIPYPTSLELISDDKMKGIYIAFTKE